MLLPDDDTESFGRTDYGYHLAGLPYAALLKSLAHRAGAVIHQARDVVVERGDDGDILALRSDSFDRIKGDLFVDASGTDAVLADEGGTFESWRDGFAADRCLSATAPRFTSIPVYGELRIAPDGWLALRPARARTEVSFSYRQQDFSDADALGAAAAISQSALADARIEALDQGMRSKPWAGNCLSIGQAACRLDPLFDLDLHVIQLGIVHLLSLFPIALSFDAERDEYNRILGSSLARLREFQGAFYALNRFGDAGFWSIARAAAMPPEVAHKVATFEARGEVAPMEDETFAPDLWQAMAVGLGQLPRSWPPATDLTAEDRIKREFQRVLRFVKDKVVEQPAHDAYLDMLTANVAR
jgi:tryptophan halogenase